MKKHIAMLCAVLLTALAAFAPGAAAAGPALTATEAYCIIDADTGLVLAQQNMNEELHPASTMVPTCWPNISAAAPLKAVWPP